MCEKKLKLASTTFVVGIYFELKLNRNQGPVSETEMQESIETGNNIIHKHMNDKTTQIKFPTS